MFHLLKNVVENRNGNTLGHERKGIHPERSHEYKPLMNLAETPINC